MGILGSSASISQYRVAGVKTGAGVWDDIAESLKKKGFRSIEDVIEEKSVGWVAIDDIERSDFSDRSMFIRKPYVTFALRTDQRKIPAPLMKLKIDQNCKQWLGDHPDLRFVPKARKQEIKDLVHSSLLAKLPPIPASFDLVWNVETGVLWANSIGSKALDEMNEMFVKTFESSELTPLYPFLRASTLLDDTGRGELEKRDQSRSSLIIDSVRDNRWLAFDFLRWLLYRSTESDSQYPIAVDGPSQTGEKFVAFVDHRLVMVGITEAGPQKLATSGPQEKYDEVRIAMGNGLEIDEATIMFEKGEDAWKLTLKSEYFRFGGFRTPKVKIERDELVNQADEAEAVFYEKMNLLETGAQMLDSLFVAFLAARLGPGWINLDKQIKEWAAG